MKGNTNLGDQMAERAIRGSATVRGSSRQESPIDLLKDLEDKIILKFRKKINLLEKKFTDDMA